jgi:hypothetical protein
MVTAQMYLLPLFSSPSVYAMLFMGISLSKPGWYGDSIFLPVPSPAYCFVEEEVPS